MRVSLLLKREPFGQIVEKTLMRFWNGQYGQAYDVRWYAGRPDLRAMRRGDEQAWLCNIYLNAIFTPEADAGVFDPIIKEFSRSKARWRRPLQQAYVALAACKQGAPRLAQAGLGVSPAVPDDKYKLLVAGNHKLRVLDHTAGLAYAVSKYGFGSHFIEREVSARKQAAKLDLPIPELKEVAEDHSWFSERYMSGAPLNRVSDVKAAKDATASAARALIRLLAHSLQEELLDDYVSSLHCRIQKLINANCLLLEAQKQELLRDVDALVIQVLGSQPGARNRISTALTHGDFQPANVLLNADGVWLIDWEYSARRQSGYDALVFGLGSRFPNGLASRLETFTRSGQEALAQMSLLDWPGVNWQEVRARRMCGAVFMLEELATRLEENANPCFVRLGEGLLTLKREIALWTSTTRGRN